MERLDKAMFIKSMRKLLRSPVPEGCDCSMCETQIIEKSHIYSALWVIGSIIVCAILILSCSVAHAYTDNQIANAIYRAEGTHSKYPYGIRSVSCDTKDQCRKICLRTIKNNRIRYSKYDRRGTEDFICYLQKIYSPINAKNDPTGLNANWQKSVRYFLRKEQA